MISDLKDNGFPQAENNCCQKVTSTQLRHHINTVFDRHWRTVSVSKISSLSSRNFQWERHTKHK